jgi:hypothetical protein
MDTKTTIHKLKTLIRDLSGKQRPLKRARKTSLSAAERSSLLVLACFEGDPVFEVFRRTARITAALNLYHELRGSEHRHGHGDEYLYKRADEELRSELLAQK